GARARWRGEKCPAAGRRKWRDGRNPPRRLRAVPAEDGLVTAGKTTRTRDGGKAAGAGDWYRPGPIRWSWGKSDASESRGVDKPLLHPDKASPGRCGQIVAVNFCQSTANVGAEGRAKKHGARTSRLREG